MKYNYDVNKECFTREDGLGKKFYINISEARRIMTLNSLGLSIAEIRNKIQFQSGKVYESTINNFINQVMNGNIDLDGDYPAPSNYVADLTTGERISNLEARVTDLENQLMNRKSEKKSFRERLGL